MYKRIFLTILLLFTGFDSSDAKDLTGLNYLSGLEAFSSEDVLRFDIQFSSPVKGLVEPTLYQKSLQLDIPSTYINPSKRVFGIGDRLIDTVSVIQHSPEKVRMRFVFGKEQINSLEDLTIDQKKNSIVISLKRLPAPQEVDLSSGSDISKEVVPTEQRVEQEVISIPETTLAKNTVVKNSDDLQEKVLSVEEIKKADLLFQQEQEEKESEPYYTSTIPDLYTVSVKTISSLFIILFVLFIIAQVSKKYFRKGGSRFGQEKSVRVLSNCPVGGKNSIALVDVAGEILVLGITNSTISLLTKLEEKKKTEEKMPNPFDAYLDSAEEININEERRDNSIERITEMIQEKMANKL